MSEALLDTQREISVTSTDPQDMVQLLHAFHQEKERSRHLTLINELHSRLARSVDLASMVDSFSVWLAPLVPHELLGLDVPDKNKRHLCCSNHGPERRRVMDLAERLFASGSKLSLLQSWREGEYFIHNWRIRFGANSGLLLVLRPDTRLNDGEQRLMDAALKVLCEALERALLFERVFEESRQDSLTGLANRRVFDERLGALVDSARRYGKKLTLLSLDLDCFKQINDNLGHAEGDRVLCLVAKTFKDMIRSSDLLVRLGGDEFALILPETDSRSALILAERLCQAIDNLNIASGEKGRLGVSIGLCQWHNHMDIESWMQQTDEALYQAKDSGRNCVRIASESQD